MTIEAWYFLKGHPASPIRRSDLLTLAQHELVSQSDCVRAEGSTAWTPLSELTPSFRIPSRSCSVGSDHVSKVLQPVPTQKPDGDYTFININFWSFAHWNAAVFWVSLCLGCLLVLLPLSFCSSDFLDEHVNPSNTVVGAAYAIALVAMGLLAAATLFIWATLIKENGPRFTVKNGSLEHLQAVFFKAQQAVLEDEGRLARRVGATAAQHPGGAVCLLAQYAAGDGSTFPPKDVAELIVFYANYAQMLTLHRQTLECRSGNTSVIQRVLSFQRDRIAIVRHMACIDRDDVADLGTCLLIFYTCGRAKRMTTELTWLQRTAEHGDVHAMFVLGRAFADGWLGEADRERAIDWWTKAARRGHIGAETALDELATAT